MSTKRGDRSHARGEEKRVGKSGDVPQSLMGKDLSESIGGTHSEASMTHLSDEVLGIAGVLHAIESIDFPLRRADLLSQLRDKRVVAWRGGGLIDFDELLEPWDEFAFGSKLSFMSFVSERLRDMREASVRERVSWESGGSGGDWQSSGR